MKKIYILLWLLLAPFITNAQNNLVIDTEHKNTEITINKDSKETKESICRSEKKQEKEKITNNNDLLIAGTWIKQDIQVFEINNNSRKDYSKLLTQNSNKPYLTIKYQPGK